MKYKYYCKKCEDFFEIPNYGAMRCPRCFSGREMLLGPYPVEEYTI